MRNYKAIVVAVVLAAGMAIGTSGTVLADSEGAGYLGTTNPAEWTSFGNDKMDVADSFQVRGPVETGALPDRSVTSGAGRSLNMDVSAQNWSPELRGRNNIQAGP